MTCISRSFLFLPKFLDFKISKGVVLRHYFIINAIYENVLKYSFLWQ